MFLLWFDDEEFDCYCIYPFKNRYIHIVACVLKLTLHPENSMMLDG